MEKIVIKPSAKEIVLRGKPEDGHVDVFSYNYEGSAANSLGSLFIVGQVQPATEDTSYMINLISSLAKREYYSKDDTAPKEAFSKTLKKINEVLQDFFRNKDLSANIGIFAVAGENIFISRLGKFKIILGRNDQNIDILNNINLFNKEHIQEKEFSNIISGKVMPKDKILAFYASRSITAREKNIKDSFLKFDADEFSEKLNAIKKSNDGFLCAAIHITVDKHTESAIVTSPQPRELRKSELTIQEPIAQTTVAKVAKNSTPKIAPIEPVQNVRPPTVEPKPKTPTPASNAVNEFISKIKKEPEKPEGNIYYPGNKSLLEDTPPSTSGGSQTPDPTSLIRPTEFSSAKKNNLMDVILKKFKPSGVYIVGAGQGPSFSKKKMIMTGSLITAVVVLAIISKLTFAPSLPIPGIDSEQDKAITALISQVEPKLESATTYINQNNFFESRKILFEALSMLVSSNIENPEKINDLEQKALGLIDQIDKAVDFSPSLFQEITEVFEDNFNAWSFAWSLSNGKIDVQKPDVIDAVNFYLYQDNMYVLTSDSILKITDATKGKNTPTAWLNKDATLPAESVLIAVDGNVFVLSKNGILAKYYKGDKVSELNVGIPVENNDILLTNRDSTNLYLVNTKFGRLYVLNKDNGSVLKTLKLGAESVIINGSMDSSGNIYLISRDNKVWKLLP